MACMLKRHRQPSLHTPNASHPACVKQTPIPGLTQRGEVQPGGQRGAEAARAPRRRRLLQPRLLARQAGHAAQLLVYGHFYGAGGLLEGRQGGGGRGGVGAQAGRCSASGRLGARMRS